MRKPFETSAASLEWRKSGTPTEQVADATAGTTGGAAELPAGHSVQRAAAHPSTPVFSDPRMNVVTTLDPALADRLADDVIRRIERRARIERERRAS
jgi:hypothetical protein